MRLVKMGLALACASAGGSALAQPVSTLAPVIVTATGFEQKLSDVIPSVSVITRDQIDRSGALSLSDLVMGEPGVEVGRNGGEMASHSPPSRKIFPSGWWNRLRSFAAMCRPFMGTQLWVE
ncbi:MAG: TonB-dependent receptor [Betaproteobacteria bacterium]|nr:TonB-dependent receptor [Betaproteobacteria bacterium]